MSSFFCIFTARKRSLGQGNIFRSVCQEICPQGGECLTRCPPRTRQVHPPGPGRYTPQDQAGTPPRDQAGTPPDQAGTPPRTRQVQPPPGPGRYTPRTRQVHPPRTRQVHPPPEIRSTHGGYASYWNAILFYLL